MMENPVNEPGTKELMHFIQKARSVSDILRIMDESSGLPTIGRYINTIREEKGLKKEALFASAGVSVAYGYEIIHESKRPSRDTLLRFAFAFQMNVEETQKLLKIGEKAVLYPKLRRDAHIIYALTNGLNLTEFNTSAVDLKIL
ncbi:MAG: helix-turn-helix domain-containing protein, partial [Lachnospiraceae bacterium]|nr:helix-turn-helix domain-containing protein [Lachnospiraceae bacterium]